jgi:hypothetical protein
MSVDRTPRFDLLPIWANLNSMLIDLVAYVPDEKMQWSPRPELWTFHHSSSTSAKRASSG